MFSDVEDRDADAPSNFTANSAYETKRLSVFFQAISRDRKEITGTVLLSVHAPGRDQAGTLHLAPTQDCRYWHCRNFNSDGE